MASFIGLGRKGFYVAGIQSDAGSSDRRTGGGVDYITLNINRRWYSLRTDVRQA
jgi:hypothetical protein